MANSYFLIFFFFFRNNPERLTAIIKPRKGQSSNNIYIFCFDLVFLFNTPEPIIECNKTYKERLLNISLSADPKKMNYRPVLLLEGGFDLYKLLTINYSRLIGFLK